MSHQHLAQHAIDRALAGLLDPAILEVACPECQARVARTREEHGPAPQGLPRALQAAVRPRRRWLLPALAATMAAAAALVLVIQRPADPARWTAKGGRVLDVRQSDGAPFDSRLPAGGSLSVTVGDGERPEITVLVQQGGRWVVFEQLRASAPTPLGHTLVLDGRDQASSVLVLYAKERLSPQAATSAASKIVAPPELGHDYQVGELQARGFTVWLRNP